MKNKIIAVDFDGTLCENKYPDIGAPRLDVIERLLQEQRKGAQTILWTCRSGEELAAAIYWCIDRGIAFEAINDNLKHTVDKFGNNTRKIHADEYWDDKAVLPFEREEKQTAEREASALALDILNVLEARVDLCNRRAEHYGPYNMDGVEAKIKAEEAETLREFIKIIIKGHGITASIRDKK